MGSEKMDDSLMFLVYSDSSGKNGKSNYASLQKTSGEAHTNSLDSNCQSAIVLRAC